MTARRSVLALGMWTTLLVIGCGRGDRTGFDVPINHKALAAAAAAQLPDDLEWANLSAGNVVFSHGVHMVYADGCEVCHPEPWGMGKSPHGTIKMAPMYEGASCGMCHDGEAAFSATACERCHAFDATATTLPDISLPGGGWGPVSFSHGMHLLAGAKCNACHPGEWRWTISPPGTMQMGPMYGDASCGVCHDGRQAFDATDCARCHDVEQMATLPVGDDGKPMHKGHVVPPAIRWPGGDAGEVVFSHTNHVIAGNDCDACHFELFDATVSPADTHKMAPMYAGRSCGTCHDGVTSFAATDCAACHEGAQNPVEAAAATASAAPAAG